MPGNGQAERMNRTVKDATIKAPSTTPTSTPYKRTSWPLWGDSRCIATERAGEIPRIPTGIRYSEVFLSNRTGRPGWAMASDELAR